MPDLNVPNVVVVDAVDLVIADVVEDVVAQVEAEGPTEVNPRLWMSMIRLPSRRYLNRLHRCSQIEQSTRLKL